MYKDYLLTPQILSNISDREQMYKDSINNMLKNAVNTIEVTNTTTIPANDISQVKFNSPDTINSYDTDPKLSSKIDLNKMAYPDKIMRYSNNNKDNYTLLENFSGCTDTCSMKKSKKQMSNFEESYLNENSLVFIVIIMLFICSFLYKK